MGGLTRRKKLGEILQEEGLINQAQLSVALKEQKRTGERLGLVLSRLNILSEDEITHVLSRQLGVPLVDFNSFLVEPEALGLISENTARRLIAIPLYLDEGELVVATVDPLNVYVVDDLEKESGCRIKLSVAKEMDILNALDQYYGAESGLDEIVRATGKDIGEAVSGEVSDERLKEMAEEAPIIMMVNSLLMQAVKDKASDIHIEPDDDTLRIRERIDGILHLTSNIPLHLHSGIVSRVKIMAGIDITEKRVAQDGRFRLKVGARDVDIRVATLPTIFGEKLALRILDKAEAMFDLSRLGFFEKDLKTVKGFIKKPHGIVLVTGPTGSGKTTTLYAILNTINTLEKNIITIEDPVEYQLKYVNQVQVNQRMGINFANGLRWILRQDPDIVMVGEIRDKETAEIAIHAALTGHLVFSTLHTNDAPGAILRLVDMGIEPFLVASSLEGVIAQRLVRMVCSGCREEYVPPPELGDELGDFDYKSKKYARGKGCKRCKGTGYLGRTGLFEVMPMSEEIRQLVIRRSTPEEIKTAAVEWGFLNLRENGIKKAASGKTSLEEILRATIKLED